MNILFGFVMASLAVFFNRHAEFTRTPMFGGGISWLSSPLGFRSNYFFGQRLASIVPAAITNMGFSLGLWLYLQPRLLANPYVAVAFSMGFSRYGRH